MNCRSLAFITLSFSAAASMTWMSGPPFFGPPAVFAAERSEFDPDELESAIKADLDDAESLVADRITVEVNDSLVTLSGTVSSLMEKRRAGEIAKRTRSVQGVINQIYVEPTSRSDDKIREDVLMRLRVNDSLDRPEIVVNVENGSVAMTGKVDSLAEKRLAETAAAGVRGVTDVQNQLTVALAKPRTDDELREEIQALIVNSVYFDDVQIRVDVEDATVKLTGTVGSAAQKANLIEAAEIWGVKGVSADQVTIDPDRLDPTRRADRYAIVSDQTIQESLTRAFSNDPIVFPYADKISPKVQSGVVTLEGKVGRLRVKEKAERLAMGIVGVMRVANELDVRFDGDVPSDAEIIRLSQAALARSPNLDRRDFRIHCQAAHVSLYGLVESRFEKELAEWIVDGVPGVVHVNNALAVNAQWEPKADEEIRKDLERKLKFALFDTSNEIEVEVADGVAILTGEVDTWRQWQSAVNLAIEAGARDPHNLLNVRMHPPHGASRIYVPR
ncbi:Osmotically-inducible protein Y precursor [Stieleria maiorica]|uniref:Osmotically-inducible protein Y n=1 Tax=Stieleria maiorica TaxID=2795974 RepID=A0A5B9M4K5_9BACT|nr:BON domain-containing protein [Stieleria maiorica]QEF96168.1 Osmotically-inducible protein Y precursor [Stieleria maiorica]